MLQACMTLAADGFLVTDADGKVVSASARAQSFRHLCRPAAGQGAGRAGAGGSPASRVASAAPSAQASAQRELEACAPTAASFPLGASMARLPGIGAGEPVRSLWVLTDLDDLGQRAGRPPRRPGAMRAWPTTRHVRHHVR
ncbi:hypothetical protein AWV79_35370 [Cupriavidus sp. UYMMa02A]|nr:hypothetical protein AWV79_35370 [Cupriavidus sp. UYMMa02A]